MERPRLLEGYQDRRNIFGAVGRRVNEMFHAKLNPQRRLAQFQRRILADNPQTDTNMASVAWLVAQAKRTRGSLSYDTGAGIASTIFSGADTAWIDQARRVSTGKSLIDVALNAVISAVEWAVFYRWNKGKGKEIQNLFNKYAATLDQDQLNQLGRASLSQTMRFKK